MEKSFRVVPPLLIASDNTFFIDLVKRTYLFLEVFPDILLGEKIPLDVVDSKSGELIIPANRKITKTLLRKLAAAHGSIEIDPSPIRNKIMDISYESNF